MAMWRVIIRIGYFQDIQSRLRNRLVEIFESMGLRNTATGTFESNAVSRKLAAEQLAKMMKVLADPGVFSDVHSHCELKHLWLYIDRV